MSKYTINEIWDLIIDFNITSIEVLEVITSINGYNIETLNDVIYACTGYNDIVQYIESEV